MFYAESIGLVQLAARGLGLGLALGNTALALALALALEPLALLTSLLHRTTLTTDATDELQHCLKLQVVNTSD